MLRRRLQQADSPGGARPRRWPAWLPRVLLESALIVLSVLLALLLDEWRRGHRERTELAVAMQSIRAIVQSAMSDVQRRGPEAVFREGFANFLLLAEDFANREHALAEAYDSALATLARTSW